jgi:hypothetical protein
MSSQDSCWHLRWLETELTLTGERSAVNVARSVRRGLAGKAGNAARWLATLQNTQDPRVERTRRHELLDIIVIAVCTVICGADDWVDVEACGNAKLDW